MGCHQIHSLNSYSYITLIPDHTVYTARGYRIQIHKIYRIQNSAGSRIQLKCSHKIKDKIKRIYILILMYKSVYPLCPTLAFSNIFNYPHIVRFIV